MERIKTNKWHRREHNLCHDQFRKEAKYLSELENELEKQSYYAVWVSQRDGNPQHKGVLFTSFGKVHNMSFFNPTYEEHPDHSIDRRAKFKIISKLEV